ncbi:MAG: hypothetical protein GF344_14795 [Chitinivibrionales bacterium]|nr:hypothetical protein [Chitinivibrionales bacterium]MBD3357978.1 hypothetical protein [Chitinivibrionales bacterium]
MTSNANILEILAPVFLVIALGALLRKLEVVPRKFGSEANQVVFWVALPVLLFQKLSTPEQKAHGVAGLFVTVAAGTLTAILVAYAVAFLIRLPKRSVGSFVQASFRGNLAFIGLPIVILSLDKGENSSVSAAAVVVLGIMVILYNIVSVTALELSAGKAKGINILYVFRQLIVNPLIIAIALGLIWSALSIPTPEFLSRTMYMLGRIALPLALLSIGMSLVDTKLSGHLPRALLSASIKLIAAPSAGWVTGVALGLDPQALLVAVVFLACPTAVVTFVLAEQLDGDRELAGGIIVVSTIMSAITLAVALWALGH